MQQKDLSDCASVITEGGCRFSELVVIVSLQKEAGWSLSCCDQGLDAPIQPEVALHGISSILGVNDDVIALPL